MDTIRAICRRRGFTVDAMLQIAGVSRNAFYTLARKDSILPGSLMAVARALETRPSEILVEDDARSTIEETRALTDRVSGIYPEVDRENVRHALLLLREPPLDRLRRSLIRGRRVDLRKS